MQQDSYPVVIVDPEEYKEILNKLDEIEEKMEFTSSEIHQRYGKKIGRDIGILYGIVIALVVVLAYLLLTPVFARL